LKLISIDLQKREKVVIMAKFLGIMEGLGKIATPVFKSISFKRGIYSATLGIFEKSLKYLEMDLVNILLAFGFRERGYASKGLNTCEMSAKSL